MFLAHRIAFTKRDRSRFNQTALFCAVGLFASLALVLERRFPDILGDRLITAVELADLDRADLALNREFQLLGAAGVMDVGPGDGQGGPAGGGSGNGKAGGGDEKVVDADFEEVDDRKGKQAN